jgi:hypothetical protein
MFICEFLVDANLQTRRTEDSFNLLQLEQQLLSHPHDPEQVVRDIKDINILRVLIFAIRI